MTARACPHPGPLIRKERERQGIGLNAFAKLIGISPAYLSDIERSNRAVTIPVAIALEGQPGMREARVNLARQIAHDTALRFAEVDKALAARRRRSSSPQD